LFIMNNLENENNEKATRFTFQKSERLCSKKIIDKLFVEGKSVFVFPLKIVYLEPGGPAKNPLQAGFAVSKKNFKRAVQRNLLKRRMREAYRLSKPGFFSALNDVQLAIFFVYTAKEIADYSAIESAMKRGLKKLAKEIQTKSNN